MKRSDSKLLMLAVLAGLLPSAASAEFPRDLQGRWATNGSCSDDAVTIKGDDFTIKGRACRRYRAVCSFWKENIIPGHDCTIIVNCDGDLNHGTFNIHAESRNRVRLEGELADMASGRSEKMGAVLSRCSAPSKATVQATPKILTEQQAHAKAVSILKGDPYGKSFTGVSKHIRDAELLRSGESTCGPVSSPVWAFRVIVPAEDNPSGSGLIDGYLVLDAGSGKVTCHGLPFLD